MKNARTLQWLFIATSLLLGTGGYFWYRSEAGVKTSATLVPSEMSASGLVGYWTFDGADYSSATVITDKSGNSHSGTLTNSPTKTTGKWGQALDFPGTNQYVSVGAVYNGVKTVTFWIWADNMTKNIIDLNATATIDVSSGMVRGNNFASPTIYIDGIASSTPTIDTAGWHFVVITTGTGINASSVDIGRISTGYFDGRLDDVRMYSSVLSASAVYQLYTSSNAKVNAPSEDPLSQSLRGYWKMDEGSGTTVADSSGNGNNTARNATCSSSSGSVAYRSSSATTYASRTNTTLTAPSGIQNGDLLIIIFDIGAASPPTPTPPAGFSALPSFSSPLSMTFGGFTVNMYAWYKFANSESGNYTVTHASASSQGYIVALSGTDTTVPFYPNLTTNIGTGTTTTATGLTTLANNSLVMFISSDWGSTANNLTGPTGTTPTFTKRMGSTSQSGILYVADGVLGTAGATGNKTITNNSASGESFGGVLISVGPPCLSFTYGPASYAGNIGPYALDFNGSTEYLSIADPSSGVLDFGDSTDFSISGWFNRDTSAADHTIVAKKNDQTTSAGYVVWIDNNGSTDYLSAEISDGTDIYSAIGTTDLSTTGWHHFSVIWDDSKGLYIYLDGKLDGSTTSSTSSINSLENALVFRIGAESDAGNPFDGKLDDIRIYGYALSADQVKKVYSTTSPTQPIDTSLVGHWTFDGPDIQGTIAIDRSNFGNNGIITGTTKTIGKLGQALSFNGTSDFIDSVNAVAWTGEFSLAFWIWSDDFGADEWIVSWGPSRRCRLGFDGGDTIACTVDADEFSVSAVESTSDVVDASWHHVVYTSSANAQSLFVDGQLEDTGTETADTDSAYGLMVGARPFSSAYSKGRVDDVRLYNRALSTNEVSALYVLGQ